MECAGFSFRNLVSQNLKRGPGMCRSCQSSNQVEFLSEINIHLPDITNLDKPAVLVFPSILICLNCGFSEFVIGESELNRMVTS